MNADMNNSINKHINKLICQKYKNYKNIFVILHTFLQLFISAFMQVVIYSLKLNDNRILLSLMSIL